MGYLTSNGKNTVQKNKRFSVYWFDPRSTVGAELRKVRPCVVVSPEEMNEVMRTVLIAPLTSSFKSWPFRTNVTVNGKRSNVACDQLRAVDKSRLKEYIEDLSPAESNRLLTLLQTMFAK